MQIASKTNRDSAASRPATAKQWRLAGICHNGIRSVLLLLLILFSEIGWAGESLRLEVVETDTERIVYFLAVRPHEPFTLWFLHSYDRAFFAEHYQADAPGSILLTHMTFKSNLNGGGFEYSDFHLRKDGVGELRNINEHRKTVHFMMGSPDMANHTLIVGDKRIPLAQYIFPGTLVDIRVVGQDPGSSK